MYKAKTKTMRMYNGKLVGSRQHFLDAVSLVCANLTALNELHQGQLLKYTWLQTLNFQQS